MEDAARRLAGVANRTPVLTSRTINGLVGGEVFMKAECFQRTGTFKFRGAYNAVASLSESDRERGVGTFSSGNHAQAVAVAAALFGVSAVIVMPEDTPPAKVDATRGYGAEIVTYDRYTEDREAVGRQLAADRGLTLVPPYEHPMVMAGQGTVALELFDEVADLDLLVVPVGGGGLIAGCSTVAKARRHPAEVVGVEPETGDDTLRSLRTGERVRIDVPTTIADGQQADIPGALTFEVNRRRVDDIVVVSDAEIIDAMRFVFDRLKVVVEPSGASAIAAVLAGRIDVSGRRVGAVISGGNVGVARFCDLVAPRT